MANRRPLVLLADNRPGELPVGDSLSWNWLADVPANLTSWAAIAPSSKADASALGNYVAKAGDTMTGNLNVPNLISSGLVRASTQFESSNQYVTLSTTGDGGIFLRPRGAGSTDRQFLVDVNGFSWNGNSGWHAGNFTPGNYVAKVGDTMTGPLIVTSQDALISSRGGYSFYVFNFANGAFGVYDGTAAAAAWTYNTASGGGHAFRGVIQAGDGTSGEKIRVGDDASLWDIGASHLIGVRSQSNTFYGGFQFGNSGPTLQRHVSGDLEWSASLRNSGNGNNLRIYDNNLDIACVDIGAGYGGATDRHGWVLNRNAAGFLALGGRNQNCQITIGAAADLNTVTGKLQVDREINSTGGSAFLGFDNRSGGHTWGWYATGGVARLWHSINGDRVTAGANGDLSAVGTIKGSRLEATAGEIAIGTSATDAITVTFTTNDGTGWIHANSGQFGFLQYGSFAWGAWIDAGANWTAAGNLQSNSDRRMKTDIRDIEDPLGLVKRMRGQRYTKRGRDDIGVIAQEMLEVLPQVVDVPEDPEKMLSVNYNGIVPVLIEAVKVLAARVEELEARLGDH